MTYYTSSLKKTFFYDFYFDHTIDYNNEFNKSIDKKKALDCYSNPDYWFTSRTLEKSFIFNIKEVLFLTEYLYFGSIFIIPYQYGIL